MLKNILNIFLLKYLNTQLSLFSRNLAFVKFPIIQKKIKIKRANKIKIAVRIFSAHKSRV